MFFPFLCNGSIKAADLAVNSGAGAPSAVSGNLRGWHDS